MFSPCKPTLIFKLIFVINYMALNNLIFIVQTNKAAKRVGEGNGVQINALSLDQSVTIL